MAEPLAPQSNAERNEGTLFWVVGFVLLFVLPILNVLPEEDSWLHLSDFALNRFGKFLAFAILALGLDLIWGYAGILSLGKASSLGWAPIAWGCTSCSRSGRECLRQRPAGFHGVESGHGIAVFLEALL